MGKLVNVSAEQVGEVLRNWRGWADTSINGAIIDSAINNKGQVELHLGVKGSDIMVVLDIVDIYEFFPG